MEYSSAARLREERWLLEPEAMDLLKQYGISVPDFMTAITSEEAEDAALRIGYPVVMKIVSPDIIHKTDAGCVKLNLKNSHEVREAFSDIMKNARSFKEDARLQGVIIYPYLPKGVEVIVGVTYDAQFGQTIMFGLGGIFVEVLKDVSFRVLPINKEDALEMIREIKAYPLLNGIRGDSPKDIDAVADTIVKISKLCAAHPEIREMDLNPVYVYENGVKVVDVRILQGGRR